MRGLSLILWCFVLTVLLQCIPETEAGISRLFSSLAKRVKVIPKGSKIKNMFGHAGSASTRKSVLVPSPMQNVVRLGDPPSNANSYVRQFPTRNEFQQGYSSSIEKSIIRKSPMKDKYNTADSLWSGNSGIRKGTIEKEHHSDVSSTKQGSAMDKALLGVNVLEVGTNIVDITLTAIAMNKGSSQGTNIKNGTVAQGNSSAGESPSNVGLQSVEQREKNSGESGGMLRSSTWNLELRDEKELDFTDDPKNYRYGNQDQSNTENHRSNVETPPHPGPDRGTEQKQSMTKLLVRI